MKAYRRLNAGFSFEVHFSFKSTERKFRLEMRNHAGLFGNWHLQNKITSCVEDVPPVPGLVDLPFEKQ